MSDNIRARIRNSWGENRPVSGPYDPSAAAVCRNGIFVGTRKDGVLIFRGIPFACPPTGALRWKPPRPAPDSAPGSLPLAYGNAGITPFEYPLFPKSAGGPDTVMPGGAQKKRNTENRRRDRAACLYSAGKGTPLYSHGLYSSSPCR